jgi:ketosteroid isomerase-like protein
VKAVKERDWNVVKSAYSTGAVLLPPNGKAISGRGAIHSWVATNLTYVTDLRDRQLEIEGCADLAYARGTHSMVIKSPDGDPIRDRGKYLQIWRKKRGTWKMARDIWNSDLQRK